MSVGNKIREARLKAGLTQNELGQKLNVSQQMIGQFENSKKTPKIDTLNKIANALGITLNDLIQESSSIETAEIEDENGFKIIAATKENYTKYQSYFDTIFNIVVDELLSNRVNLKWINAETGKLVDKDDLMDFDIEQRMKLINLAVEEIKINDGLNLVNVLLKL